MSNIKCQMSNVKCQISNLKYQISHLKSQNTDAQSDSIHINCNCFPRHEPRELLLLFYYSHGLPFKKHVKRQAQIPRVTAFI